MSGFDLESLAQLKNNREQARSHSSSEVNTLLVHTSDPMWERACSRWRQHCRRIFQVSLKLPICRAKSSANRCNV